jgi:hypothetical protein
MGGKQSRQQSVSKCNYSKYENEINTLKKKYANLKSRYLNYDKQIQQYEKKLDLIKNNYKKLESVCTLQENNSIKETGEKIFQLMSDKYKNTINLMSTQQDLINRQNNLLGQKDLQSNELNTKLTKINDNIVKNDRLLELHKEEESYESRNLTITYIITILVVLIIIIILLYYFYFR